jgi:hypothetical protein
MIGLYEHLPYTNVSDQRFPMRPPCDGAQWRGMEGLIRDIPSDVDIPRTLFLMLLLLAIH